MSTAPSMEFHRPALAHLAEMTSVVLEAAFARVQVAEGPAFLEAVSAYSDLGRGLRLTIALDLRVAAFARVADQPVRLRAADTEIEAPDFVEPVERPDSADPVEREREREIEHDGYPMDALGRVSALQNIITRTPDLDPDRKVSAQIIELKAFLEGPEPTPPEPRGPVAERPSPTPTLNRPPNRAERRRLRHASG